LNNRFASDQFLNAPDLNITSFLQQNSENLLISNYTAQIEAINQNKVMEFSGTQLRKIYNHPQSKGVILFPIRKLELNNAGDILAFSMHGIKKANALSNNFKSIPITLHGEDGVHKDFKLDFSTVVKWNDSIYYGCRRTTAVTGFVKFNLNSGSATQYKLGPFLNQNQPISNSIHFLYKDFYERLWCCSDDRGLSIFNPATQLFEHHYRIQMIKARCLQTS